jgi:hypothetical protein
MLKECYAMEKIHGTSAHLSYKDGRLKFFSGGGSYEEFIKLFNASDILQKLSDVVTSCYIYGEYYGGKIQKMRDTYGDIMRFVAFEVKIDDVWLNVPKAHKFVEDLGLEFVHYIKIPATIEALDAERDAPSVQAVRNGVIGSHKREGIVIRPLEEMTLNNGKRIIAKHKGDEFKETRTPRKVISEERLKIIKEAKAIADEWVTLERLNHILTSGVVEAKVDNTGKVIKLMTDDILREAEGEIVDSSEARKCIGRETALLFKEYLKNA